MWYSFRNELFAIKILFIKPIYLIPSHDKYLLKCKEI